MCGIVGYIGEEQAAPILLNGLQKLEYRGYDSAGVAVYNDTGVHVVKSKGRLSVLDGKRIDTFPPTSQLKRCKPILEVLPGWKCDIGGIKKYEDLPENARKYVEFAEKGIGVPITMVSNGPARDDIIYR